MKRVCLYLRVSTDKQTTDNQRKELEGIAHRRGWEVVEVFEDNGVSGSKGRDKRPALDRLLKEASRRKFDVVMCWALDRLGRSLSDLLGIMQHLEACGVDLYIDKQNLDTTTPAGKLLFHVTGAFAEFERDMIRQRVLSGLDRAKKYGTKSGKPIGRPQTPERTRQEIRDLKDQGVSLRKIAERTGVSLFTVQKVLKEAAYARWKTRIAQAALILSSTF
jgi:DNA invertase Pin-like site-specific DNA recombinase